jgi:NADPH:quinone reductase-like Zn-dependent oxidoreductase
MLAAYAAGIDADAPLTQLVIGEIDEPPVPEDWVTVHVRAASLNHHDVWALRGAALSPDRIPMILGTDAAGITDDGTEVIVHAVIGDPQRYPDETLDPKRTLLSELWPGTIAERVRVPRWNLIPKPASLSFEEAACLPTAWLTAYRMIAIGTGGADGQTLLVQGAAGGVSSAAITMGKALGLRVWVTSRTEEKREWALKLGADAVFEPGARLPERVDAVIETVGEATFDHSMKSLRPGGSIVVSGATSGNLAQVDLRRVFALQLRIIGSSMGTKTEFEHMLALLTRTSTRPVISDVVSLANAHDAFSAMERGDVFGKLVVTP